MEAIQEIIYILLRIPILVTFTRIAQIAIVPQLFKILVFDVQQVHQSLVVIQTLMRFLACQYRRRVLKSAKDLLQQFSIAQIVKIVFAFRHFLISFIMAQQP